MNRKLLLIGNPGIVGVNYVPSVPAVLQRYKEFFKREAGGWWSEDEIILEPNGLDYNSEITWLACKLSELTKGIDYSIIVFVGHGGSYCAKDMLQLSQGAVFPLNCLLAEPGFEGKIKRTIIVDACRSILSPNPIQLVLEGKTFSGEGQLVGYNCREYYNQLIDKCEPHVELLQSTRYGEVACTSNEGTAFSDALFEVLNKEVPIWNKWALSDKSGQLSKCIPEILPGVQTRMTPFNQVPEYRRFGGVGDFPLYAVWRETTRVL